MEFLRLLLLFIHLVGFTMLLGGFLAQYVNRRYTISVLMRAGLGAMIGSGLLLALPFPAGEDLNYVKLGVKFGVALLIGATFGLVITRERAGKPVDRAYFLPIGLLTLANAAIAIFWR